MADLFIPFALFLLPFIVLFVFRDYSHSFLHALIYVLLSFVIFLLILKFDNGIEPIDGAIGSIILAPYFVLSIPLSFFLFGLVCWYRKIKLKSDFFLDNIKHYTILQDV